MTVYYRHLRGLEAKPLAAALGIYTPSRFDNEGYHVEIGEAEEWVRIGAYGKESLKQVFLSMNNIRIIDIDYIKEKITEKVYESNGQITTSHAAWDTRRDEPKGEYQLGSVQTNQTELFAREWKKYWDIIACAGEWMTEPRKYPGVKLSKRNDDYHI